MAISGDRKRWIMATESMKAGDVVKNSLHLSKTPGKKHVSFILITMKYRNKTKVFTFYYLFYRLLLQKHIPFHVTLFHKNKHNT